MLTLRVNGKTYQADAEPATPLLWVLRDSIGLNGGEDGSSEAVNSLDAEGGRLDDRRSGESK